MTDLVKSAIIKTSNTRSSVQTRTEVFRYEKEHYCSDAQRGYGSRLSTVCWCCQCGSSCSTRDKGQAVYVNDARVYPTGYNIADNNYFKLRDIGALVGFGVEWNGETQTVEISTARTTPSTEGISDTAASGAVAKISDQRITVDGVQVSMTAYQIDGNNYVKLRDIGKQVDFGVGYDNADGKRPHRHGCAVHRKHNVCQRQRYHEVE